MKTMMELIFISGCPLYVHCPMGYDRSVEKYKKGFKGSQEVLRGGKGS